MNYILFMYTATVLKLCICIPTLLLFILIGVTLSLRGDPIPTDGSGRIVITDINPHGVNVEDALVCQSEMPTSATGDWYLHHTQLTTDDSDRVQNTDPRGWRRDRAAVTISGSGTHRLVRLRRDDSAASGGRALEGVFTCDISGDTNTPVSVGIYYPSQLHVECHLLNYYYLPEVMHNYIQFYWYCIRVIIKFFVYYYS